MVKKKTSAKLRKSRIKPKHLSLLGFFLILIVLLLTVFILKQQESQQVRGATSTLFSDSFSDAASLNSNWPVLVSMGSGITVSKQWSPSGYDKLGGSVYTQGISDGTPLPGMTKPVANVIASHPLYQYLGDGIYQISGAFMTKDLTNLGAYQLLVMFEHNGWTYQATFHYRVADWSQMPAPNNNPAGIYVYDYTDKPIRLGTITAPKRNNQWVTMKGTFDTVKMEYVSVELNGLKMSATGVKLVRYNSDLYGSGAQQGQINLSTAGKIGALKVSGYYDVIIFDFQSAIAVPTPTPTPTPSGTPVPTPKPTATPTAIPSPTLTPTPTGWWWWIR